MFGKENLPEDIHDTINRWGGDKLQVVNPMMRSSGPFYNDPGKTPSALMNFLRPGGDNFKGNIDTAAFKPDTTTPAAATYAIMRQQGIRLPPVPDRLRSASDQVRLMGDLDAIQKFKFSPDPATNSYLNVLASQYTNPYQGKAAIHRAYGRDFKLNSTDIKSMFTQSDNQWQLPWRLGGIKGNAKEESQRSLMGDAYDTYTEGGGYGGKRVLERMLIAKRQGLSKEETKAQLFNDPQWQHWMKKRDKTKERGGVPFFPKYKGHVGKEELGNVINKFWDEVATNDPTGAQIGKTAYFNSWRGRPPVKEEEEEEEDENLIPKLLMGAGGAALGTGALLRSGMSADDAANLEEFSNLRNRDYDLSELGFQRRLEDYVTKGHEAAKATLFGRDSGQVAKTLRTNPIASGLGYEWKPGSAQHYEAYADSPFSSYLQNSMEKFHRAFGDSDKPKEMKYLRGLFKDDSLKSYPDVLTKHFGIQNPLKGIDKAQYFQQLADSVQEFQADETATGSLDDWIAAKKPDFHAQKRQLDITQSLPLGRQVGLYGKTMIDPITTARKYLPYVGGAAIAGGGAWMLHNYLKKKREKEEEEQGARAPELKYASFENRLVNLLEENTMRHMNKSAIEEPAAEGMSRGKSTAMGAVAGLGVGGIASLLTGDWKWTPIGGAVGAGGGFIAPDAMKVLEDLMADKPDEPKEPGVWQRTKDGTKVFIKDMANGTKNVYDENMKLIGDHSDFIQSGAWGTAKPIAAYAAWKGFQGGKALTGNVPGVPDAVNKRIGVGGRTVANVKRHPYYSKVKGVGKGIGRGVRRSFWPSLIVGGAVQGAASHETPEEQAANLDAEYAKSQEGLQHYAIPTDSGNFVPRH